MTEENEGEVKKWKVIYADDKVLFSIAEVEEDEEE
jgi:hypothetical protein